MSSLLIRKMILKHFSQSSYIPPIFQLVIVDTKVSITILHPKYNTGKVEIHITPQLVQKPIVGGEMIPH